MNTTLRKALIIGGSALAAVLTLVLVLPFIIPMDAYKGRVEAAAGQATGRALRIEGPLRLMFFPHPGVRAQRVALANVPGGRAVAMASVGDIEIAVRFWPLLTGRVALDEIVLNQPTIALEVDAEGNENWKFGKATAKSQNKGTLTLPSGTEFSDIKIRDGRITYDNAKTGSHRAVDHVNAEIGISRIDQPVSVKGDLSITGKKVEFAGKLSTLKTFLGHGTTGVELSAQGDLIQTSFKGTLAEDGLIDGVFKLQSSSFRELAAWLGEPLPGGGLNAMALTARVRNQDKVTSLNDLRLSLDGQTMTGNLAIDASGPVTALQGALQVDHLDLNPYLASPAGTAPNAASAAQPGWSRAPISVGLLKKFNAKLSFQTGAVRLRGLRIGHASMTVVVDAGVLNARLDPVTLYGGSGSALLAVDARGPVPAFSNTLSFQNIALLPFLKDTMGVDSIEGTGALTLEVTSRGRSADAVMHALAGKGSILGANGRFRGVDLARVARSIQMMLARDATSQSATTDFHTMGGTFTISNGVLSNNDFQLAGPVVQMNGAGRIDIGNRGIDFRIEPRAAVAGLSIGVPFRIYGSWDKVQYAPDLKAVLGGVVDNLKNGRAPLKGLLDGDKKKVGDVLKDVLGIH